MFTITPPPSLCRYLVPHSIPNTDNVHGFLTCVAHESLLYSWRDFQTQLDKTNSNEEEGHSTATPTVLTTVC